MSGNVGPGNLTLATIPNATISAPKSVSVGTTYTRIDQGTSGRKYILIVNNSTSDTIYVGGATTVTTANGIPVAAGASLSLNLGPSLKLYAISTATCDVRVFEAA